MHGDFYYLGRLQKVHGVRGGLLCPLEVSLPEEYEKLESVYVEIDAQPVPFFISDIHIDKRGTALIHFEGIDTTEKARAMVGKTLWRPLNSLPPLSGNHFYYHEITGYTIADAIQGNIGKLREVLEMPAQDLLAVEDSDGREYLLPLTDDCVVHLDRAAQILTIHTPEGLIELYRSV